MDVLSDHTNENMCPQCFCLHGQLQDQEEDNTGKVESTSVKVEKMVKFTVGTKQRMVC